MTGESANGERGTDSESTAFSDDPAAYTVEQVAAYLNTRGADELETAIHTPHQGHADGGEHVTFGDPAVFDDPPEDGRDEPPENAIARVKVADDPEGEAAESIWMGLWNYGIDATAKRGDRSVFYLLPLDEPLEYPFAGDGSA